MQPTTTVRVLYYIQGDTRISNCCQCVTLAGSFSLDSRTQQFVEHRKLAIQVRIPSLKKLALLSSTHPAARALVVSAIEPVDDFHTRDYAPDGRESLRIKPRVVAEIDVELSGPRVGAGHRIGSRSTGVALTRRIIFDGLVPPHRGDRGVAGNPELNYKARSNPKEARIVKESRSDEVVQSICTHRRPAPPRLDYELTFARLDSDSKESWRHLFPVVALWMHQLGLA